MTTEESSRLWARTSYFYFVLVAFMGLLLRFIFIHPVPGVNYKYFLHAHSHTAFMGWIFNALFAAIVHEFVPKESRYRKKYWILFGLLQISVLGMLVTFPIGGYYRDSIIFSSMHIFLSYIFAFYIFREGRSQAAGNRLSWLAIRISLVFMILSSIGPYALGPLMAMDMSDSPWYNLAIYFYLHFQYNGWFAFAIIGLSIKLLDDYEIAYPGKLVKWLILILAIACIPAYALSASWAPLPKIISVIGLVASVIQIVAMVLLVRISALVLSRLAERVNKIAFVLISLAYFFFIAKNFIQFLSAFEDIALLGFETRNYIIAYLHMIFIGFCSLFLLGWFSYKGWMSFGNMLQKGGLALFVISFLLNEGLMALYPTLLMLKLGMIPNYVRLIFYFSAGMPMGLLLMAYQKKKKKKLIL